MSSKETDTTTKTELDNPMSLYDYEDKLKSLSSEVQSQDLDLFQFPEDNVQVICKPQVFPQGMKVVPDSIKGKGVKHFIEETLDTFTKPKVEVVHKYKNFQKVKLDNEKFPPQKFESDLKKKKEHVNIQEDNDVEVDLKLLKPSITETKTLIDQKTDNRLWKFYDMTTNSVEYDWNGGAEFSVCKREREQKKMELKVTEPVMIEITQFETKLGKKLGGEMEPLFISMALFDLKEKKKVSETVHMDLNSNEVMQYLPMSQLADSCNKVNKAVFHISERSSQLFLFVKISKVIQGDEDSWMEPYLKSEKVKDSEASKLKKAASEYSMRLGNFKQPMAWTSICLFDENESLCIPKEPISQFYRCKGNLSDAAFMNIFSTQSGSQMKKLKSFPASLTIKATELVDYKPVYQDCNLVLVNNQEDPSKAGELAKDTVEFPLHPPLEPNSRYINNLYIQLESVNLSSRQLSSKSSRNISVKIQVKDNDKSIADSGLPVIFGGSSEPYVTASAYSHVTYHNRHPEFNDEFKIELPPVITPNHHLFFTFYHVQCKQKSGKPNQTELGYAIVPILDFKDHFLISGRKLIPIIQEFGKTLAYNSEENLRNSKFLDGGKGLFQLNFVARSTIYPSDSHLSNFFNSLDFLSGSSNSTSDVDDIISNALRSLAGIEEHTMLQNMNVILNQLLRIICRKDLKNSQRIAFYTLLSMMDNIYKYSRTDDSASSSNNILLNDYVQETFDNRKDTESYIFLEIPSLWLTLLEETHNKKKYDTSENKLLFVYSWALFDLTYKSIALYLDSKKRLSEKVERSLRVEQRYFDIMLKLVRLFGTVVIHLSGVGLSAAKLLNVNLALHMRYLLNLVDRSKVLGLMLTYLEFLSSIKTSEVLRDMKISFLTIIGDYEHLVQMSLPLESHIENAISKSSSCISELYKPYYLCGMILEHCKNDVVNLGRTARIVTFHIIQALLTKHEYDERYQSKGKVEKIAAMYFPFVAHFIDKFDEFQKLAEEKEKALKAEEETLQREHNEIEQKIKQKQAEESEHTSKEEMNSLKDERDKAKKKWEETSKELAVEAKRVLEEERIAFLIFLYVVKNLKRDILIGWLKKEGTYKLMKFLQMLGKCLSLFEYPGKNAISERSKIGINTSTTASLSEAKVKLENMYMSMERRSNIRESMRSNTGTGKKNTLTRGFRLHRQTLQNNGSGTSTKDSTVGNSKEIIKQMVLWEGNMATEVSLSILHIFLDIVVTFENELAQSSLSSLISESQLFNEFFEILKKLLEPKQSEKVLKCSFAVVNHFVIHYRAILFPKNTPFVEPLCSQFFSYCYSKFKEIRAIATAATYNLIRNNYIQLNNFGRTKILATLSLSNLVNRLDETNINLLKGCFKAITIYATNDKIDPSEKLSTRKLSIKDKKNIFEQKRKESKEDNETFPTQVKILVERLGKALMDTIEFNNSEKDKKDFEFMAELYLRNANSYRHAPELSASWYNNLSRYHNDNSKFIEAAQAVIYIAAMAYQYLKLSNQLQGIKLNYSFLSAASPLLKNENFSELKALFDDSNSEIPSFQSNDFTESGFVALLERAISYCNHASHFEYSIQLYKLIVEYLESVKDYERLQKVHSQMADLYGKIARANSKGTRLGIFGSYYKVAFYGQKFSSDIRDKQFIYKMPKITRLAEIMDYLNGIFHAKFGAENVKIVGDSFQPTEQIKKEDMAYIQITAVKPYFDNPRDDLFEQSTNLCAFTWETPFTKSGKAQSSQGLIDQYKRKTVVRLAHAFPTFKTRLEIQSKTEIILTPIENAMEIIEQSLNRLASEAERDPPNINNLQMVLSGTVIPQVNEGIPQIVRTFLGTPNVEAAFGKTHVQNLKSKLVLFLLTARKAIQISNTLASNEQKPLQHQFMKGFDVLVDLFKQYIPNLSECLQKDEQQQQQQQLQQQE